MKAIVSLSSLEALRLICAQLAAKPTMSFSRPAKGTLHLMPPWTKSSTRFRSGGATITQANTPIAPSVVPSFFQTSWSVTAYTLKLLRRAWAGATLAGSASDNPEALSRWSPKLSELYQAPSL